MATTLNFEEVYAVIMGSLGGFEKVLNEDYNNNKEEDEKQFAPLLVNLVVELIQTILEMSEDNAFAALDAIRAGDIASLHKINADAALILLRVTNFAQSIYWAIQETAYKTGDKIKNKIFLLMATQQAQVCLKMVSQFASDEEVENSLKTVHENYAGIDVTMLSHQGRMGYSSNGSKVVKAFLTKEMTKKSAVVPAVPTGTFREVVGAAVVPPGAPKKVPKESPSWADMVTAGAVEDAPKKALFAPAAAGAGEPSTVVVAVKKSWAKVAATK